MQGILVPGLLRRQEVCSYTRKSPTSWSPFSAGGLIQTSLQGECSPGTQKTSLTADFIHEDVVGDAFLWYPIRVEGGSLLWENSIRSSCVA